VAVYGVTDFFVPDNRDELGGLATGYFAALPYSVVGAGKTVGKVADDVSGGFTSSDPLVGDLANKIEKLYPGLVKGVNVPVYDNAGRLITDADILLNNAIIQVKSGGGKGLLRQIVNTETATGIPTIGYGPNLKGSVVNGINQAGELVTTDLQLLLELIKP